MSLFHKICWSLAALAIVMLALTIGILNREMEYFHGQAVFWHQVAYDSGHAVDGSASGDCDGAPTLFARDRDQSIGKRQEPRPGDRQQ